MDEAKQNEIRSWLQKGLQDLKPVITWRKAEG